MSWIALGFTLDVIGKIMIALSVIYYHERMHKNNEKRSGSARLMEREIVIIGILLMFIGYILQISSKFE